MRCPCCGGVLDATVDGLVCRRGGMELSGLASRELALWLAGGGGAEEPGAAFRWGGVWHCPSDGTRMRESDGRVTCPECGRHLSRRLLYMLIKLHTHSPIAPLDDVRD